MKLKWLAAFCAIALFSCKKEDGLKNVAALPPNRPIDSLSLNLSVDDTNPGYPVSPLFEGLSYETALLAQNPEYLNGHNNVMLQLMKNLGSGVLRIGGNSSDLMNWEGNSKDTISQNIVINAQVDRLAVFTKASGWPVIFGLNLANKNVDAAVAESEYVYSRLGSSLLSLQNGNEPDVYNLGPRPKSYGYHNFNNDWQSYYLAIKKEVPKAVFSGPDVTPFNDTWLEDFAGQHGKNVNLLDGHYYVTGPASRADITYTDILSDNKKLYAYLSTLHLLSTQNKTAFRISECNSVYGQGKNGVSNVFASALWALDFMWTVAENNGQGINFHGGNTSFLYSPIAHPGNKFIAQPEYYAMLAFKYGAVGQTIIPAALNANQYNIGAHAVVNKQKNYTVTLINKELNKCFFFKIHFNRPVANVQVARLSAPKINSGVSDGVTFAGSQVNEDGTFQPNITENYQANGNTFTVRIPPGSAAVISTNQ